MTAQGTYFGSAARYRAFTAVKYVVYVLLCFNVYLFLDEELGTLEHTFSGQLGLGDIIQVFAATIDTAAWVVLLLLFELETSVLDDSRIRGNTKRLLHGVRLVCGAAIVYAFTGYNAELLFLYEVSAMPAADYCAQLGQGWSLLVDIDEYEALSAANCGALADGAIRIGEFDILAAQDTLTSARYLAWTDVINSAAWILVVIVLEVEVRLQLRGLLTDRIMRGTLVIKYVLYATLFAAAGYWGYAGDFIDIWDASLWLFAFIFIELNVFEWQYETSRAEPLPA